MEKQDTVKTIEEYTDKYIYDLPKITIAEYAVLAIVCFYIVRRFS